MKDYGYQLRFIQQELLHLPLAGKDVLEIGCGSGSVCRQLAEHVPQLGSLTGIHLNNDPRQPHPSFKVLYMDACEMAFDDRSFDFIYSLATFEHIHDLQACFREIARVLRPGGRLIAVWSPIWNGFNGHHYGSDLKKSDMTDIDLPWAHLVFDRDTLPEYLIRAEGFDSQEAQEAIELIYDSSFLNRLTLDDYKETIQQNTLHTLEFNCIQVDFPGLWERIHIKLSQGFVQAEQLLNFFRHWSNENILTYKLRLIAQRP